MLKHNDKTKDKLKIIFIYNIIYIGIAVVFYPLIPRLLNYPPGIIDYKPLGVSYFQQYCIIISVVIFLGIIVLNLLYKGIDNWKILLENNIGNNINEILAIRKKCFNLPYVIYFAQIVLSTLILFIVFFIIKTPFIVSFKIITVIFTFSTLGAVASLIFSKKILSKILLSTYKFGEKSGFRIGIKNKIFIHVIPIFMASILFTSLVGYSRLIEDKSEWMYRVFKEKLEQSFRDVTFINNINEIKEVFNVIDFRGVKYSKFIIDPSDKIITLDNNPLDKMFVLYLKNLSEKYGGRVYGATGEIQGVIIKIKGINGLWTIGIKYDVTTNILIITFLGTFIMLLILNSIVLYYFSSSLSEDISLVAQSLTNLAEGEKVDLDQKIPVTSNDEIGDLVVAFNKILDLEKENIRKIHEKHEMLIQSERLASLGQMIGGIAHNLKTPIMSIAGGTEALKDLINEYRESVDDLNVTKEDHLEIAGEMLEWVKEIKSHCAYMSDIISAVKEQAVQMNYSSGYSFTLEELVKRIEILMKYELKKYNCRIEMDIQVDLQTEIEGELNNLVQVFNNLILNAIQAYDEQGGKIDLIITAQNESIEFVVRDYGKGIAPEIKDRLFKEMVTTKGAKGTGIGLYMSYLTVKGKFGGNIWFESEQGEGTVFHLTVPVSKNRHNTEVS
ncbi:MAG: HAMP domain-containing histidine kinase [Firmicutes bacterium]|nr:HAMP domain-containing histidine kinase [Bacillota bacterium]